MRTSAAAMLTAVILAGCGGGDDEPPPRPSGSDEAQIRRAFADYNAALVDKDFDRACELITPETVAKMRTNIGTLGGETPKECPDMFGLLYERAEKDGATKGQLSEIARTAKITTLTVKGDAATVNWSAKVDGQEFPISQPAKRVDGQWKLHDVSN